MEKQEIVYFPVSKLKPYKGNPRKISEKAVDAVCAAIKDVGFRRPIDVLPDMTIINGHGRWKAAKKLGLKEVPCIVCSDLDDQHVRRWRIEDNKTGEYSHWDADLLSDELLELDFSGLDFDFDFTDDLETRKKWEKQKVACDLKDKLGLKRCNDTIYHSLFRTGKNGKPIEEIKVNENVRMFAQTSIDFIQSLLGPNLKDGDWCILTTPRRRHKEGFHFATEISRIIGEYFQIPFYEDAFESENVTRLNPIFTMLKIPKEKNVIIYDDVLTTGYTLQAVKQPLIDTGHITFPVISIDNH